MFDLNKQVATGVANGVSATSYGCLASCNLCGRQTSGSYINSMTCCETNNCNTGSFTSKAKCAMSNRTAKATSMYAVLGLCTFALKQEASFY